MTTRKVLGAPPLISAATAGERPMIPRDFTRQLANRIVSALPIVFSLWFIEREFNAKLPNTPAENVQHQRIVGFETKLNAVLVKQTPCLRHPLILPAHEKAPLEFAGLAGD